MHVTNPPVESVKNGTVEYHALLSDLHIGSSSVSYKKIAEDLKAAKKAGAIIHINGDTFDAILPKDMKRYDPRALHERLQGRADVLNAAIDWAVELLGPYAPMIHEIGEGNHETAVTKHHGADITLMLIDRLRGHGLPKFVQHGGYCGYYRRSVKEGQRNYWSWDMYRSHGAGGASPVTKGIIDFERMRAWVTADVVWIGHKHNRLIVPGVRTWCNSHGKVVNEKTYNVMTGAYMDTYGVEEGTKQGYAASWNIAPQPMGGWLMSVRYRGVHGNHWNEFDFQELN